MDMAMSIIFGKDFSNINIQEKQTPSDSFQRIIVAFTFQ